MKVFEGFTNIFKSDDYDDEDFINEDDYLVDDDFEEPKKEAKREVKREKKSSLFGGLKKERSRDDDVSDSYFDDDPYEEPDISYNSEAERDAAEQPRERSERTFSSHRASSARVEKAPDRKVVPLHSSSKGFEVVVIHPESMEDGNEITDTLLSGKAVILNLEGINPDIAQRIIDYTAGSCYAMRGSLQKISNYIFLVAPSGVDISGDFQDVLGARVDVSSYSGDFRFN